MYNRDYFECVCGTPEHVLRFTYIPEDKRVFDDDGEVYVETYLNRYYGFWRRLWVAAKYVLGLSPISAFDCTVLNQAQTERLALLLSPELRSLYKTKQDVMGILGRRLKGFIESADKGQDEKSDQHPNTGDVHADRTEGECLGNGCTFSKHATGDGSGRT